MVLSARHRRRARELADLIRNGRPEGDGILGAVVEQLSDLLHTDQAVAYGLEAQGDRVELAFLHSPFPGAFQVRHDLPAMLAKSPLGMLNFDPRSPSPEQRNRVFTIPDLDRVLGGDARRAPMMSLLDRCGFTTRDQLRVLVCDGPVLLAWVGAFRDRPFTDAERWLLGTLVRPLRDRLTMERRLAIAPWAWASMAAAMEVIGTAAVVVRWPMRILHANPAAQAMMATDRQAFLAGLRDALGGRGDGSWTVTRLRAVDEPRHFLAVRRSPPADAGSRAAILGRRMGLTPRQTSVLALVARGEANKGIAVALRCGEGAVEQHVTALLRRFDVENRAALVAQFWSRFAESEGRTITG